MWMAAGFCMLESGLVTSKSVSVICAKNIGLYSIAGIMFWAVGYNLAYGIPEGGFIGNFNYWSDASKLETGYADSSDWFFQMVFCATTASIVSGTMAERVKLWPFFLFTAILTGIIYPIQMGWQWGGGWLAAIGFSDFAGSTLVHSCGGAAALAGVILLGPRLGRFKNGSIKPMAPFAASSIPLATLGVFILWLGWFGFNVMSAQRVEAISGLVAINSLMAMVGGTLAANFMGKNDPGFLHNGPLAGLVAICAGSDIVHPIGALLIGGVAGALFVYLFTYTQNKLKVDDVLGVWPLHGVCGAFGGIAAGIFGQEMLGGLGGVSLMSQIIGTGLGIAIALVGGFVVYGILKATLGIRLSQEDEYRGADLSIHKISANSEESMF